MSVEIHPIAAVYRRAEQLYEEAQERLREIERHIEEVQAKLAIYERQMAAEYGPGYFTAKTVRNRQGRRYTYLVWRLYNGKDIYLRGRDAEEVRRLREQLRALQRERNKYKRLMRRAFFLMKASEDYKEVCLDKHTKEYIPCPQLVSTKQHTDA